MTEEILRAILRTLQNDYDFDALTQLEFTMKLEREMGTRFPDDWTSYIIFGPNGKPNNRTIIDE